jgi:hypothetical protein
MPGTPRSFADRPDARTSSALGATKIRGGCGERSMVGLLSFALVALLLYLAWRAIRGGFERPQSERLNTFGVIGGVVLLLAILSLVSQYF